MSDKLLTPLDPGFIEIAFIAEGNGYLRVEQESIRTSQGDLYILPVGNPGVESASVNDSGESELRIVRCIVSADSMGMAAPLLPMRWKVMPQCEEEFVQLLSRIPDDKSCPSNRSPGEFASSWARFMELLMTEPNGAVLQPLESGKAPIRQALLVIGHRFMNPLSVTEMSRLVAMSTRHFQRMFKSLTGRSFIQMLQEVRIRHSCGLLRFTRLSVQAVAQTVGFYDMYYFYRLFRTHCGTTPAEFRLRHQAPEAF